MRPTIVMKFSLLLFILLSMSPVIWGQHTMEDFLKKIKRINTSDAIFYDYKVFLVNDKSQIKQDSLCGKLYKKGADYLDSNGFVLSARNKEYYCKFDFKSRAANVYDLNILKAKLGMDFSEPSSQVTSIPDSIIIKYGKMTTRPLANRNYEATIQFEGQSFSRIVFEVNKDKLEIYKIQIELKEMDKWGEASGYKRIYVMNNIRHEFDDKLLDLDRFFKIEGGKIILDRKYAKYNLNTLNN